MSQSDGPTNDVEGIEIDAEIATEFLIESAEQLAESDENLLILEADPSNEDARAAVFRCFHTIKGLAGFLGFHPVEHLAHGAEDLLDQAQHIPIDGEAIDAVFSTVDLLRRQVAEIEASMASGFWSPTSTAETETLKARIHKIYDRREEKDRSIPAVSAADDLIPLLEEVAADEAAGDDLVPQPASTPAEPTTTTTPLSGQATSTDGGNPPGVKESIRVDASRLDHLVDLVGEIVITESMVQRSAEEVMLSGDGMREWERHITRLGKLIREVQELAGTLRMVPVRPTFHKMARLARDVSHKANKDVHFGVRGEGTELDKNLVDRIGDPLVHIIRNAIDHGIEANVDDRIAAGKSPTGQVELIAAQQGGSINIKVTDDGCGLDRDAILAKAVERGVIHEGDSISDHEVYNLICESGFSTASEITEISGRGVGMDVVRKAVESMGGKLMISSERGAGTTFTMNLPLTLAVIDGMVVQISGERFILPKLSVVRLVTPEPSDLSTIMNKGEMLRVQGDLIPVLRITDIFGLDRREGPTNLALVAEAEGQRVALIIDEILDQQQLVVKSLGVTNTEGLSGCAIMPDGRVGLVLDVIGLTHLAATHRQAPLAGVIPAGPADDDAKTDSRIDGKDVYATS